jgi:hypothetical protein
MKTLKEFLIENKAIDQKVRDNFDRDTRQAKLDGNGRFNSLSTVKAEILSILKKHNLQVDSSARYDLIFRGDSDIIGQKGKGTVNLRNTKNMLVISWEHNSSGYSALVYLS